MNDPVIDEIRETAKEYCSTVEAICAVNALGEDDEIADRILLIPKTL